MNTVVENKKCNVYLLMCKIKLLGKNRQNNKNFERERSD